MSSRVVSTPEYEGGGTAPEGGGLDVVIRTILHVVECLGVPEGSFEIASLIFEIASLSDSITRCRVSITCHNA